MDRKTPAGISHLILPGGGPIDGRESFHWSLPWAFVKTKVITAERARKADLPEASSFFAMDVML